MPYAQWIEPSSLEPDSPLAPFIQRKLFLTKFDIHLSNPAGIADDFVFPFAASDAPYHHVEVHYEPTAPGSRWWLISLTLVALAVVLGFWFAMVGRRRPE